MRHDESHHQSHAAEQLEVDPGCSGKTIGNVQIDQSHGHEKGDPGQIEAVPDAFRQRHLLLHHGAYQVLAQEDLAEEQGCGKAPVQYGRLPFDEGFIVEVDGRTTEDDDDGER